MQCCVAHAMPSDALVRPPLTDRHAALVHRNTLPLTIWTNCRPAGARETLALQPVAVRRRRKKRGMQQVLPVVEAPKPLLSEGVRAGLFGVGALALLALGYIAARKLLSAQLPKVQKVRRRGLRIRPCGSALSADCARTVRLRGSTAVFLCSGSQWS